MEKVEYTVAEITGDYAVLVTVNGERISFALMLLPPDIEQGDRIIYENFSYRKA